MTFFFDNCISPKIARALRELGVDAAILRDEFDGQAGVLDVDWMPVVASKDWIAVTDDHRIRKAPAEKILRAKLRLRTVFLWKNLSNQALWEQARWIIANWPKIGHAGERLHHGECLLVKQNGTSEKLSEAEAAK